MAELAALSLACNIMQIIEFATEATQLCKSVYQRGCIDDSLHDTALALGEVSEATQAHQSAMNPTTAADKRLIEVAAKCTVTARAIADEYTFLNNGASKGNLWSTISVAAKVNWRKKRLERLERSLEQYRRTFETQLLVQLR